MPPYDKLVQAKREGKQDYELIQLAGMETYRTALMAVESVPEGEDVGKYLNLLVHVASLTRTGSLLQKLGSKMLRGEETSTAEALQALGELEEDSYEWITMDAVEAEGDMWRPTYWKAWDEYLGGMPKYGLIIIAAPPGVGKTSAVVKLIDSMTRRRMKCGFMSLELTSEVAKMRWQQIRPDLPAGQAKLLRITDNEYNINEACAAIARLVSGEPEIAAVFIDFADMLNQEEESTENAGKIYMKLAKLAKKIEKPIFLISQLSRAYRDRGGGIPHVTDIRYSGLAEAVASMITLVYNPDQIFADDSKEKSRLTYMEGRAYLILGKARFGYIMGGVGAVQLDWNRAGGWGNEGYGWTQL